MTYLLDTNICIHLFKGHENLERKIESVGINACYLCEITIAELLYGVENSALSRRADNRKNLEWLRTAFAGRIVRISLCFDEYARQKVALKRIGRPVGEFDLLIGSKNHILVTRNIRDFDNLDGIRLENWIDS